MKKILSFASMLAMATMFASCEGLGGNENEGEGGGVTIETSGILLSVDNDVINADGEHTATLTVKSEEGEVITEGITFFDGNDNEVGTDTFKFTTDKEGSYTFWASYKTHISKKVTVTAINPDVNIPEAAADPSPSKKDFVRRVFINQYTGTKCGYCPGMVNILYNTMLKDELKGRCVLAAIHSYDQRDPAYISAPRTGGYPFVTVDMAESRSLETTNHEDMEQLLKSRLDAEKAKVGISANPVFADNLSDGYDYLMVKVSVKAAETGFYTVGAWLLEDGIYGKQDDYLGITSQDPDHDYDNHDNCLRVADSKNGSSWIGYDLGKINEGDTVEKTFMIKINDKLADAPWDRSKMHLAIFAGAKNEEGAYSVNNVIDCPVNKATPFDYSK